MVSSEADETDDDGDNVVQASAITAEVAGQ